MVNAIDPVANRDEWLESRRRGLGGSDIAALFDVHPWMSKYTLYLDKIGELPKRDDSAILQVGHALEPLTRKLYCESTGRIVETAQECFKHKEHDFMLATIDGSIPECDYKEGYGVFEGKTTNTHNKDLWNDGPPLYYALQTHHYMEVTGRKWGSVAVLVLGEKDPLMWTDIEHDNEFADMMIEAEKQFWNEHVVPRAPPDVDSHPMTTRVLKALHPNDNNRAIELPDAAIQWQNDMKMINYQLKELKREKDLLENQLRQAMGENTYGVLPDGSGFSYRTQDRDGFTVKPKSFRVMRTVTTKAMDGHKRTLEKKLNGRG